jgi:uncharacterized protein YodC (DUF2158 family)
MPLLSLPPEIHYRLVEDLDAEAKLALAATNRYLRLLILEKHTVSTLIQNALLSLEIGPFRPASSFHCTWMRIPHGSLPCYTCFKILPYLQFGLGDFPHYNAGKRVCMTCRWADRISGSTKSFRYDNEPWLYCEGCKMIVHGPSSSQRVLGNRWFPGIGKLCYKCTPREEDKQDRVEVETAVVAGRVEMKQETATRPSGKRRKL